MFSQLNPWMPLMKLIPAAFQLDRWPQLIQPAYIYTIIVIISVALIVALYKPAIKFIAFVIPIATIIALYMYGQKFKKDSEGEILSNSYTMLVHALLFVFCIWAVFLLIDTYFPDIDSNQSQNETQAIKENNQKDSKQSKAYQTLANEIPKMIVGGLVTAILTLIVFGIIINNRPPSQADKDKEALKLLTDFIAGAEFTKARLIIQKHLDPWRCSFDKNDGEDDKFEKFAMQHLVKLPTTTFEFNKKTKSEDFVKFEEYLKYWEVRDPRKLVESLPNNSDKSYSISYDEAFSIRKVLGFFWLVNTASEKGMIGKDQDIFNYHYAWYWQNIFRFRFATCIDNGFCRPLSHFFNQGKQGETKHFFGVARSEFQAFLRGFLNGPKMEEVKKAFEQAVIYLYVTVCCEIYHLHLGSKLAIDIDFRISNQTREHIFPKFDEAKLFQNENGDKKFFPWKFFPNQTNKDEESKIKHTLEYFNELHFILKDCFEAGCFDGLKELAEGKGKPINSLNVIFENWKFSEGGVLDGMVECVCNNDNDFESWRSSWNIKKVENKDGIKNYVKSMLCASIEYHFATEGEKGTKSNKELRPMYNPIGLYKLDIDQKALYH